MKPIYDYDDETGVETVIAWEISHEERLITRDLARTARIYCYDDRHLDRFLAAIDVLPTWMTDD